MAGVEAGSFAVNRGARLAILEEKRVDETVPFLRVLPRILDEAFPGSLVTFGERQHGDFTEAGAIFEGVDAQLRSQKKSERKNCGRHAGGGEERD